MIDFKKIKQFAGSHWHNIPGWRTNRKIVVFESDDWGSIRMPSKEVYNRLLKAGIRVDKLSFNRFDSLASEEDLTALFEVLQSVKDKNGNPAVFTANTIVANPDFEKIRESNFSHYYYEPFTQTLKKYPKHSRSFQIWQEGISADLFKPQFHGREHVNVPRWMKALRNNTGNMILAFENQMFDLSDSGNTISENSFMDALAFNTQSEFEYIESALEEGAKLFEQLFGYKSESFIASCYIWDSKQEDVLKNQGIKYLQSGRYQNCPIPDNVNRYKRKLHFTGEKNANNQIYLVRNCFFEPSETGPNGIIEDCMMRIRASFRMKKPVIIGSHRLNYIGFIVPENRDQNLRLLNNLLVAIIKEFPDVEFMTSKQLGELIAETN